MHGSLRQMAQDTKPKKIGRPKLNIEPEKVEQLASFGCSNVEIAAYMECDEGTIRKRFSENLTKGRESGKIRLRQAQMKLAIGQDAVFDKDGNMVRPFIPPNATMLIWMGKNVLGQSDRSDVDWDHNIEEVKFIEV